MDREDRSRVAWAWTRRIGLLLVAVVVAEYAAVHLLAGARESWTSAASATPLALALAFLAEVVSLACFSCLTMVLLPRTQPASYPTVLAVDLTGWGLSHVVPGGGATATTVRFRLLARAGVPRDQAIGVGTIQSALSVFWYVAAFVVGLILAVPAPQTQPLLKTASVLAVVLVITFGGLVAVLMARPDQVVTVTHALAKRLPLVRPQALENFVRTLIGQVHLLLGSRVQTGRAAFWGLANWSLDAACLYLSVWAYGAAPSVGGLLTTYALVSLIALLPLTPGGLGIVEGVAVPALVSFGTANGAALLGVLTWRLFQFWMPVPIAAGTYLWLRVRLRDRPDDA